MKDKQFLESINYIITNDCEQRCVFCIQKHGKEYITKEIIDQSIKLFYKDLTDQYHISFYGGEPLLGFDQICYIVEQFESLKADKKSTYSLTTCGRGLGEEQLNLFSRYPFDLNISYNAYQAKVDKGYQKKQLLLIKKIMQNYQIKTSVNMVFGPGNIDAITSNVQGLIKNLSQDITITCDIREVWEEKSYKALDKEFERLIDYLQDYYKKFKIIPISNFRDRKPGILKCDGANDRIAITPTGEIWGCYLFHDYFRLSNNREEYNRYKIGSLNNFNFKAREEYQNLKQIYFATDKEFCFKCDFIEQCSICPISAGLINRKIGIIPKHLCKLEQISIKFRIKFQKTIKSADI